MFAELFKVIFTPFNLLLAIGGNAVGLIFGAIPGLSVSMALALFLPVSYVLPSYSGIVFLANIYVGAVSGGLFGSILLGIPGTTSAVATTYDGYPMTQNGQATKALGIGIVSSFIGTTGSVLCAMLFSPLIAKVAILMGPWEIFSLCFCAIVLVVTISKGDMWNGLISALFGILFACIGFSPIDGAKRFSFGIKPLLGGINSTLLILGLFALGTVITNYGQHKNTNPPVPKTEFRGLGVSLKELAMNRILIIRSFFIGLWIGFLPGMGGGLSNQVSYAMARNASKSPETFGKGNPEGVYATEVANNASIGGAVVPMITLGIPGDSPTTLLLSALIVFGLEPGPMLMVESPDFAYLLYMSMIVGAILAMSLSLGCMRAFPKILSAPYCYLFSAVVLLSFTGAYSLASSTSSLMVCVALAIINVFFVFAGLPKAPFLLGFILSPMLESNLRKGLTYTDHGFLYFLMRPASCLLLLLAFASLFWPIVRDRLEKRKGKKSADEEDND